jgi:heat shock protein HslJ
MRMRTGLSSAALAVLLVGCESVPERSPLTETRWEVVTLNGKAPIPTSKPLTAEFLPNGTMTGFGGINGFRIGWEIHGKRISVGKEIESTLKGSLDPALAEQETAYQLAIGRTRSFFIDGGDLLHLCGSDGTELVTLKRLPR